MMRARAGGILVALAAATAAAAPIKLSAVPVVAPRVVSGGEHPRGLVIERDGIATATGCLVEYAGDTWLDGDTDLDVEYLLTEDGPQRDSQTLGVERFVAGAKPYLDRTLLVVAGGTHLTAGDVTVYGHSRVPLYAVAEARGLVVYAYRRGANVYLVVPVTGASVRFQTAEPSGGRRDTRMIGCDVATTQLRVANGASESVRIAGVHAGRGFSVDASVSKTSRDPEPLLTVTVRI